MGSRDSVDIVREATDIIGLIEEHFPLKKTGVNYKALCPFHHEKTPSFVVSYEKQLYKCFGCGESGDVFTFIMKMENISFFDALKRLAEKKGIKLDYDEKFSKDKEIKDKIFDLNSRAAKFFHRLLQSKKGSNAMSYIKNRDITFKTIESFMIGYAPEGNLLIEKCLEEGIKEEVLVKSGLAGKGDNGQLYSMFRNRIMFPIYDERGRVSGFGGRVLDDSVMPKYLNTAQTLVFDKSKTLYGFFQGKERIRDEMKVMVLEGYMDVVMAHQHGFTNTIAALGTSLTKEHIYKLKHWVDEVILVFDADEAGSKATARGLEILIESDLRGRVCILPEGQDPDDFIRNDSEKFQEKINSSELVMNWLVNYFFGLFNAISDKADRNRRILNGLEPYLKNLTPLKKTQMVHLISEAISVNESVINRELDLISNRTVKNREKEEKPVESAIPGIDSREDRILKDIFHFVLKFTDEVDTVKNFAESFKSDSMYFLLTCDYIKKYNLDLHAMRNESSNEIRQLIEELSLSELEFSSSPHLHIEALIKELKKIRLEKRFEELSEEITNMINNNEDVDKNKKEEYEKITKALKGIRKKINVGGGSFG